MPVSKKRKFIDTSDGGRDQNSATDEIKSKEGPAESTELDATGVQGKERVEQDSASTDVVAATKERQERFKALQARAKTSAQKNMKEAAAESQRLATDPNLLSALSRKHAIASHNLLKADTNASGEDFERKRAWDWTVDEAERWDKRMEKKERHRQEVAFEDYRQDSRKVYKRQLQQIQPDLDRYEKEKMAAVQRAAISGGLEIVETEDGELVAVDRDGTFYTSADSTEFVENKPDRAAVDRLVADLRKAEEARLRKRRDRGKGDDEPDVTYINDKNKQFNQKLARFYNKYTAEIRDSFERGTMI
ncbi:MAG: pre-mRNA-splicing factor syf2 [Peltula sp. TS41687]|nr:MAG: pre-mRNA-splicing factor syf2 [Peltula sp. TS41687]